VKAIARGRLLPLIRARRRYSLFERSVLLTTSRLCPWNLMYACGVINLGWVLERYLRPIEHLPLGAPDRSSLAPLLKSFALMPSRFRRQ
jgi:hypothetical protein